jgi:hypothetical protein
MWKLRISLQIFMNLFKSEEVISRAFITEFHKQIGAVKEIRKSTAYVHNINRIVDNFRGSKL